MGIKIKVSKIHKINAFKRLAFATVNINNKYEYQHINNILPSVFVLKQRHSTIYFVISYDLDKWHVRETTSLLGVSIKQFVQSIQALHF